MGSGAKKLDAAVVKSHQITLYVSEDVAERLDSLARERGITISQAVRNFILAGFLRWDDGRADKLSDPVMAGMLRDFADHAVNMANHLDRKAS